MNQSHDSNTDTDPCCGLERDPKASFYSSPVCRLLLSTDKPSFLKLFCQVVGVGSNTLHRISPTRSLELLCLFPWFQILETRVLHEVRYIEPVLGFVTVKLNRFYFTSIPPILFRTSFLRIIDISCAAYHGSLRRVALTELSLCLESVPKSRGILTAFCQRIAAFILFF